LGDPVWFSKRISANNLKKGGCGDDLPEVGLFHSSEEAG
jgi:hypothetical protein